MRVTRDEACRVRCLCCSNRARVSTHVRPQYRGHCSRPHGVRIRGAQSAQHAAERERVRQDVRAVPLEDRVCVNVRERGRARSQNLEFVSVPSVPCVVTERREYRRKLLQRAQMLRALGKKEEVRRVRDAHSVIPVVECRVRRVLRPDRAHKRPRSVSRHGQRLRALAHELDRDSFEASLTHCRLVR